MKPAEKKIPASPSLNEDLVLRQQENGVVTLTLNRPKQFNALSEAMLSKLQHELDSIATNEDIRLIILQGAGKVFCAGHDLKEMISKRKEEYYRTLFLQHRICNAVEVILEYISHNIHKCLRIVLKTPRISTTDIFPSLAGLIPQ